MLSTDRLATYLAQQAGGQGSHAQLASTLNLATLRQWALEASMDDLKDFAAAGAANICAGTVSAGDLLFAPPATMIFHKVLNAADVIGLRVGLVATAHKHMMQRLVDGMQKQGLAPSRPMVEALSLGNLWQPAAAGAAPGAAAAAADAAAAAAAATAAAGNK